jgi:opacity protein-like surface antigen
MKTVTLAALAVMGAGLAASSASAAPINPAPGIATAPSLNVIQVGNKKWNHSRKWRHRRHRDNDFNFGFGFGLPFVALGAAPYYDRDVDCIGRWHRHYRRLHCHGQLVYDY